MGFQRSVRGAGKQQKVSLSKAFRRSRNQVGTRLGTLAVAARRGQRAGQASWQRGGAGRTWCNEANEKEPFAIPRRPTNFVKIDMFKI